MVTDRRGERGVVVGVPGQGLGVTPTGVGWTQARVPIESIAQAHGEFPRLGADIEVVAPVELRDLIAATVRTLVSRYDG